MTILQAIEIAGRECLPITGGSKVVKKSIIPGWNEYAKPLAEESRFWHSVWVSQGKPSWGETFETVKNCSLTSKTL